MISVVPNFVKDTEQYSQRIKSALLTQPQSYGWWGVHRDHERRFDLAKPPTMRAALHRVAAEGWSAERAADEAIARIKQILRKVTGLRV